MQGAPVKLPKALPQVAAEVARCERVIRQIRRICDLQADIFFVSSLQKNKRKLDANWIGVANLAEFPVRRVQVSLKLPIWALHTVCTLSSAQ